jgi:valyl-tRNA synthetase
MQTAVSDLEVVARAVKGKLYTIKYYSRASSSSSAPPSFLLVATSRPETVFGDVAVAVHPADRSKVRDRDHRAALLPVMSMAQLRSCAGALDRTACRSSPHKQVLFTASWFVC